MPTRTTAPAGAPCWIELFTSDAATTKAFYTDLFGWTCEDGGPEYGGYLTFSLDGQVVAGGMVNDGSAGAPDAWSVYLATDDVARVAAAAPAHGGMVMLPPMEVMDLGSMAVLGDPGGAAICAWQPGVHQGFVVLDEPGAPSWFELHTPAYEPSVAFYAEVFGWPVHTVSDGSDFRYTTHGVDDGALAGIMDSTTFAPEGAPARWYVYFGTDDTDASLARVVELGGTVVLPAEDTPYGRIAEAADPTGITFKLRRPPVG